VETKEKVIVMLLICGTLWIEIQDFLLHQNYQKNEILTELFKPLIKQSITVMVGTTRRLAAVRWGIGRKIVYAWIITIPASAAIGAAVLLLFQFARF
jgi:hypothetical protein